MAFVDNVATMNDNVEQSNTSNVNIPKNMCTYKTVIMLRRLWIYQLTEFVDRGICKLTPYSLHSFGEKQIRILQVCRNIATTETIFAIEKWNHKYDADKEYWEDNFMEQTNYQHSTVQSEDYLQMYKSKAIYSIHYFLNNFLFQFLY